MSVVRDFVGDGAKKLMERVVADLSMDSREALREFRAHYGEHCTEDSEPYPGVVATLERLQPLPMAVVSNKPQEFTERVVEGLGLGRFFGSVVGARRGVPVKPDPALLSLAAAELEIRAADAWMVGDSPNDLIAARRIGCGAVAVSYGLKDRSLLEAEHPDALLDRFDELLELLQPS